jgi:hypothetical protein
LEAQIIQKGETERPLRRRGASLEAGRPAHRFLADCRRSLARVRQYFCPSCATLLETEVCFPDAAPVYDEIERWPDAD